MRQTWAQKGDVVLLCVCWYAQRSCVCMYVNVCIYRYVYVLDHQVAIHF